MGIGQGGAQVAYDGGYYCGSSTLGTWHQGWGTGGPSAWDTGCLCSRGLVCSGCSVWVRGKVHYMWVRYVGSLVPSAQPYSHPSPLSMVLMTHLATSLISAPPAAHDWGCAACDVHVMCLRRTPAPPAPLYHVISVCASCLMCRALPPAAPPVSTHPQHL